MTALLARLRDLVTGGADSGADRAQRERLATALLLAELARADFDVSDGETTVIAELLARRFDLDAEAAEALLQRALMRADGATSLYDYVETLNARLDYAGRCDIVEMLWQVAYADGRLDKYEEHELRKIAGLLYVDDADFIRAKLNVTGTAT